MSVTSTHFPKLANFSSAVLMRVASALADDCTILPPKSLSRLLSNVKRDREDEFEWLATAVAGSAA